MDDKEMVRLLLLGPVDCSEGRPTEHGFQIADPLMRIRVYYCDHNLTGRLFADQGSQVTSELLSEICASTGARFCFRGRKGSEKEDPIALGGPIKSQGFVWPCLHDLATDPAGDARQAAQRINELSENGQPFYEDALVLEILQQRANEFWLAASKFLSPGSWMVVGDRAVLTAIYAVAAGRAMMDFDENLHHLLERLALNKVLPADQCFSVSLLPGFTQPVRVKQWKVEDCTDWND